MAHVVNVSGGSFPLEIGTGPGKRPLRYDMKAGDVVDVEDAYGRPRQPNPSADPMPSIVEAMTNGNVVHAGHPRAKDLYAAWQAKQAADEAPARPAKGR
jgi:hypothetical protein